MPFNKLQHSSPDTSHKAQRTSIESSSATMCDTNSHLPPFVSPFVSREVRRKKKRKKCFLLANSHLSASSISGCARKTGRKTIAANAEQGGGRRARLPACVDPPVPSIVFSPVVTFFCPPLAAENMQTCGLGTLSQWSGGDPHGHLLSCVSRDACKRIWYNAIPYCVPQ